MLIVYWQKLIATDFNFVKFDANASYKLTERMGCLG
jgi:hypothetical protein